MNRRNYILAGNYLMLDELYSEKAESEKKVKALEKELNVYKSVVGQLKKKLKDYES